MVHPEALLVDLGCVKPLNDQIGPLMHTLAASAKKLGCPAAYRLSVTIETSQNTAPGLRRDSPEPTAPLRRVSGSRPA